MSAMQGNQFVACVGGPMNGRIIPMPMGASVVFVVSHGFARHVRYEYRYESKKCGEHEWLYLKYAGKTK